MLQAVAKSRYEEDVYPNNHTSVWGSFFDPSTLQWGFACCHNTIRSSYCTGEAGKSARQERCVLSRTRHHRRHRRRRRHRRHLIFVPCVSVCVVSPPTCFAAPGSENVMKRAMLEAAPVAERSAAAEAPATSKAADLYGEQLAPNLDPKKLRKALKKASKRTREAEKEELDERGRKYNSLDAAPYSLTEEDMEAYKMIKVRDGDVMAAYVDEDEAVAVAKKQKKKEKKKTKKKKKKGKDSDSDDSDSDSGSDKGKGKGKGKGGEDGFW